MVIVLISNALKVVQDTNIKIILLRLVCIDVLMGHLPIMLHGIVRLGARRDGLRRVSIILVLGYVLLIIMAI